VITSNNPGEGKTFCSINLAAILAKAGKKVLLLELDLHKPRVQKGLNMSSEIGISTILIGKHKPEECVLHSQIENLDVILSGPIPPNASELLLSDHQKTLLEFGKKNYDAMVLMSMSDISLFVLNTKFAYREAITNAHEIVAINKLTNFGFILNGVKRKRSRYYYNRYAYGYGYGYGYGGRYGYGYGGRYGGYYGGGYGDSDTTKK
jgi:capsular exopolysaccharide synthesis family protein